MRIGGKLRLGFLFISLIQVAVAVLLSYAIAQRALKEKIHNQLHSLARIQKDRLDLIIDQNLERLSQVTTRTGLTAALAAFDESSGDEEGRERLLVLLRDARRSNPDFTVVHLLDADGAVVASTDPTLGRRDFSRAAFFLKGRAGAQADTFARGPDGEVRLYLSAPLKVDGVIVGVLVIASRADNFLSVVSAYEGLGKSGETLLAKREPNGDALFLMPTRFDPGAALRRRVSAENTNDPIIRALQERREEFIEDGIDYRGVPVLALTEYLDKPDFGFVVKVDQEEAFAAIVEMRNLTLLALGGGLAVLGGLFVFLGRSITRPIHDLTETAAEISAGDLSRRVEITTSDETGVLGRAFNQMTESLVEANTSLERKVAERTAALVAKNKEIEEELELAREIQNAFLPGRYPTFPPGVAPGESALRFAHRYLPSTALAGDFFVVQSISDTEAGVFICDVMGHGVRSALVAAILRGLLQEQKQVGNDPGRLLTEINNDFVTVMRQTGMTLFATAFYLVADTARGELRYAHAGHPWPLRRDPSTGRVSRLPSEAGEGSPALGLIPGVPFETFRCPARQGDLVLLFTDGLVEVENGRGEAWWEDGLAASVQRHPGAPVPALLDAVLEDARRYSAGGRFDDDVCIVALDVAALPGSAAPVGDTTAGGYREG